MKKLLIVVFNLIVVTSIHHAQEIAITKTALNLRDNSSTSAKVLTVIPKKSRVQVYNCRDSWCYVSYSNHYQGYVAKSYLKEKTSNVFFQKKTLKSKIYLKPQSTVRYYQNVDYETVQSPTKYNQIPAEASAICRDGTYSFSRHRRGTCSHHGGVKEWL